MTDPDAAPAMPGAGPDTHAADPVPDEPGGTADWRDALAPELRSFARQFAAPADAVKTALELRRKLSTAVQLPGPDDDPEKRLGVFDRLGRPETPDGYTVTPPDGLPDWISFDDHDVQATQRSFLETMHAAGATQDMVDAALGWYWDHLSQSDSSRDSRLEAATAEAEARLRREWGRDFDTNLEHAARAVDAFGGDELADTLAQYGLTSHPAVVRAFARVGRTMGEDDMISGPISETTREQLRQRAEELVAEDDYWTNDAHQREMREIMLQLYGDKEIGPGAA